jgi:hypothetical protein
MKDTRTEHQPCETIMGHRQSFDCHLHKKQKSGTPKLELATSFVTLKATF